MASALVSFLLLWKGTTTWELIKEMVIFGLTFSEGLKSMMVEHRHGGRSRWEFVSWSTSTRQTHAHTLRMILEMVSLLKLKSPPPWHTSSNKKVYPSQTVPSTGGPSIQICELTTSISRYVIQTKTQQTWVKVLNRANGLTDVDRIWHVTCTEYTSFSCLEPHVKYVTF